jgi:protein-tyrosine phosphatase
MGGELKQNRRGLLAAGGAIAFSLAAPGLAVAAGPSLQANVTRANASRVRIDWSPAAGPVDVFIAADTDAPLAKARRAVRGAKSAVELDAPAMPRPYFFLVQKGARPAPVAERLLPLQGGRNFRDLGGYEGANARRVRWGRLYRSGVMNGLTDGDRAYLASLGLRQICDLRTAEERAKEPTPAFGADPPVQTAFNHDMGASMGKIMSARSRDDAVIAFGDAYVEMATYLAPNYTDMFARLARGEAPLTVNCTAGKDRTGVASAMILSVLGVDRETIIADYALSAKFVPPALYLDPIRKGAAMPNAPREAQAFAAMPDAALLVIMGSDADVMRRALARIDAEQGGPIAFAKARYGLTDATIGKLRDLYLA